MRSRLGLPALAALAVLLVVVLGVLVSNNMTDGIDQALIRVIRAPGLVAPLNPLRQITELGSTTAMMGLAIVLLLSETLARRPWTGITAAATIGLASLANELVKVLVERARPDLLKPIVAEHGYSFPSGHSGLSMVGYGIAAVLVAHSLVPRAIKLVTALAAGCLVVLVGISRVYLGAHYPTDVAAGWLAGGAIVLLFVWLSPVSRERAVAPAGADRAAQRSGPPARG
ncbi:MAG: phosphatase PAP2 family protein [Chloroflexota bacterium]